MDSSLGLPDSSMVALDGSIHNPTVSAPYINNLATSSNTITTMGMPGMMQQMPNNTNSIHAGITPQLSPVPPGPLNITIDFSRPDAQRTRPLSIDNKKLYVDEHYVSVWSPILVSTYFWENFNSLF
jgi:hypothetical protein